MNVAKTDFILIGTSSALQRVSDFKLDFCESSLEPSDNIKVLGVKIDQTLSWQKHVTEVLRRCYSILSSLNRFRRHFSAEALILIIQAHVFSQILYCLPVWGGACKNQISRVQKVINFAARVVTGTRRHEHITPTLSALQWPTIEELIKERDCLKVFRALNNCDAPKALKRMFHQRSDITTRVTRLACTNRLHLPKVRLSITQRSFPYRAATEWNRLPIETTQTASEKEFRKKLRCKNT